MLLLGKHLAVLMGVLCFLNCGREKTEPLTTNSGQTALQKCGAARDFSVSITPDRSIAIENVMVSMKGTENVTVRLSREITGSAVTYSGKISTGIKYQFRVTASGKTLLTSEVIDPKAEPTYQGCSVSRNCNSESGKLTCATPL